MKYLFVTHSSRRFQEERASLNLLETRFGDPGRLDSLPAVESYPGVDAAVPFDGALSVWGWDGETGLDCLGAYRPGFKVQFAEVVGNRILVLGSDRLEVLDGSLEVVRVIRHPHLIGSHTVFSAGGSLVWVTTAPGNAALLVDIDSGAIVREQDMPAQYGQGHSLTPDLDLTAHCVPTDAQATHVNCAVPHPGGLLVTLWIPGALGVLGPDGEYREIVSGYRGCHGGRINSDGQLYFSDSAAGIVWFMDPETGAVRGRFQPGSRWVHDCAQVEGDVYACTLSDDNELLLFSRSSQRPVARAGLDRFGASAMFVNVVELDPDRARRLAVSPRMEQGQAEPLIAGPDAVPPVTDTRFWTWYAEPGPGVAARYERRSGALAVLTDKPLGFEVVLRSSEITLAPGVYRLLLGADCAQGRVQAGFEVGDKHLCVVEASREYADCAADLEVDAPVTGFLVVAASNTGWASELDVAVRYATIQIIRSEGGVRVAPRKGALLRSILTPGASY